jgi:hypothetical protein
MTKHIHIVYVHPIESGEPNLYKVKHEVEYDTKKDADAYIETFNAQYTDLRAVYYGCVNDETGELV